MWCKNLLGDNKGSISHILQIDTIAAGYALLTFNLITLKSGNTEPILTLKIIEWRKLIDYFGQSIEANPSRAGKKNVYIFHIGDISIPSSVKLHLARQHIDKNCNL